MFKDGVCWILFLVRIQLARLIGLLDDFPFIASLPLEPRARYELLKQPDVMA